MRIIFASIISRRLSNPRDSLRIHVRNIVLISFLNNLLSTGNIQVIKENSLLIRKEKIRL